MTKKLLIPLMLFFFLLPLCFGFKNEIVSTATDGELTILFPRQEIYGLNKDLKLNFVVLNSSGKVLNSTGGEVDCNIGIENSSSNVLIDTNAVKNHYYFSPPIYANKTGFYGFIIVCNSSESEYGFVDSSYFVTDEGKNYYAGSDANTPIVYILGVFAVVFLLSYIAFKLDKEKHFFLQLIILLFVVVVLHLIPKAIMDYSNMYNTGLTFYKSVLWFVRIFWAYIFFYVLYELGIPLFKNLRMRFK